MLTYIYAISRAAQPRLDRTPHMACDAALVGLMSVIGSAHQKGHDYVPMPSWFARPVDKHAWRLQDTCVSKECMHFFLRFRMGCHRLPKDEGSRLGQRYLAKVTYLERVCRLCTTGTIGDEKHLLLKCFELQGSCNKRASLFSGPGL